MRNVRGHLFHFTPLEYPGWKHGDGIQKDYPFSYTGYKAPVGSSNGVYRVKRIFSELSVSGLDRLDVDTFFLTFNDSIALIHLKKSKIRAYRR